MKKKTRVDTDVTLLYMKHYSDKVVKWLVKTPITPNQITIGSFLVFAPSVSYLLLVGGYRNNLIALGLLFLHSFLDLMDGEMVRQGKKSSRLGIWFESSLDPLLQMLVILSIVLHVLLNFSQPWRYLVFFAISGQWLANSLGVRLSYKFKIDPLTGNHEFNNALGDSGLAIDRVLKNIIVPSTFIYMLLFTLRFHMIIGILLNILPYTFTIFGFFISFRALVVYLVLTLHYSDIPNLDKYATFRYLNQMDGLL